MTELPAEGFRARVRVEQFRASLRLARMLTITGATLPVPLFAMLMHWSGISTRQMGMWFAQFYAVLAVQYVASVYGERAIGTAKMGRAMLLRDVCRVFGGVSMGSIAWVTVYSGDRVLWMFCLLSLIGIMSANVMDGYGLQRPFLSFVAPMTAMGMYASTVFGGHLMIAILVGCPVFALVLAGVNWQVGQVIIDGIELRLRLQDANVVLAERAETDELTGLANRMALKSLLQLPVEDRLPAAVLFMDLDGFKEVNDVHGHEAGDVVLRVVADRIKACLRSQDSAIRLGGDEFLVLLSVTETSQIEQVSGRIADAIRQPIQTANGSVITVGTSVGWATTESHTTLEAAISEADHRMYVAKALARRERLSNRSHSPLPSSTDMSVNLSANP
jgi:diguanylate cyclase (GGDEF)-like protein